MMKQNIKENIYRTTDLALASFLSLSCTSFEMNRLGGNKCVFVFRETEELVSLIESFFANTGTVSPFDYFNAIKKLKTMIYTGGNNVN